MEVKPEVIKSSSWKLYIGIGLVLVAAGVILTRRKKSRGHLAPVRNISEARPSAASPAAPTSPPVAIAAPTPASIPAPVVSTDVAPSSPLEAYVASKGGSA